MEVFDVLCNKIPNYRLTLTLDRSSGSLDASASGNPSR